MGPERHFLEVAIYRISADRFDAGYSRDLARHEQMLLAETPDLSERVMGDLRRLFWMGYGGPWQYNQAVGWLRLLVLGTQIRADLWMSSRQRFMRRAIREFRLLPGDYFHVDCWPRMTSEEIGRAVETELLDFQQTYRGGRFTLDTECFNAIKAYIDWRALVTQSSPS